MKKIYARELDGEYFDYRPYLDDDMLFDENNNLIAIYGNSDYCGMNADLVKDTETALQDCKYDLDSIREDEDLEEAERNTQINENVRYYFGSKRHLTDDEVLELARICDTYNTCSSREEYTLICKALSIKYGVTYTYSEINGCCQGDWQYIFYPKTVSQDFINYIEAVYFNTGTEFQITENMYEEAPDFSEEDVYCDYTYLYRDEDIKNWIAKNSGVTPEEVCLIKIKNSYMTKHYEYEEV